MPQMDRETEWKKLVNRYPRPFDGTIREMKGGKLTIQTIPGYIPKRVYSARVVPIHLEKPLRDEIDEQVRLGIAEWVHDVNDCKGPLNPMVAVRKKDATHVRMTIDLRDLNAGTYRPVYLAASPGRVMARINKRAKIFTVRDGH